MATSFPAKLMSTHILRSLKQSSRDIRLLWVSVFIRMMSFGLTNQVLTLYLKELGISESQIGIFMSLTMAGDSLLSYILTWNAHRLGNRNIMIWGAILMIGSGLVFASGTDNFIYLLSAAILGVISPSGSDTGPFKTIEETVLAHLTPPNHRPEIYAIHWVLGSLGSALGSFSAGLLIHYQVQYGLTYREACQYVFGIICFISVLKLISILFLSYKTESSYLPPYQQQQQQQQSQPNHSNSVDNSNYGSVNDESVRVSRSKSSLNVQATIEHQTFTGLSPQTQKILFQLLLPFMLDSFGYGFMPGAWTVYYFKYTLHASALVLGVLFSCSDILMSISALPSAWFGKRVGPIKATIFTQIPCAVFLILIPLLGKNVISASIIYLSNQVLTAFDVVPRQIILTSIVQPHELPKVMGTVNIGKQIARSISPYFTGLLAERGYLWVCFIINGCFLGLANLILAYRFRGLDQKIRLSQQINHEII